MTRPRLSLSQMPLNEVQKDFRPLPQHIPRSCFESRKPHTSVTLLIRFSFSFSVFRLCAFGILGYRDALLVFYGFLLMICQILGIFFDLIVRKDAAELGARLATVPLACTYVGALWSTASRSTITIPLLDIRKTLDCF